MTQAAPETASDMDRGYSRTECHERSCLSLNSTGFHNIVYSEWGCENDDTIVCVHGLTGNGHDFNWLAPYLAHRGYRVIAVDMPGRGRSDFLENPQDYNYSQYFYDLSVLLAHLGITEPESVDWIGISMGGLLGICLAAMPNTPIRRLMLNDIGPAMPQGDLDLIAQYISQEYRFDNLRQMEDFMRQTRGLTWGPVAEDQWAEMAENNARALDDGVLTYSFDPKIAEVFATEPAGDLDLWQCWDAIKCPVLAFRGAESTIFPQAVADEMLTRGPGAKDLMALEVIDGVGHVPALMNREQIELVGNWFDKTAY